MIPKKMGKYSKSTSFVPFEKAKARGEKKGCAFWSDTGTLIRGCFWGMITGRMASPRGGDETVRSYARAQEQGQ
jgi:hypothetical protein